MRAHDAGERIAIRDPDPRKPKLGGARDHLLGMRGPAQKRKIRHRRQFGEPRLKADHLSLPPARGGKVAGRSRGRMRGSAAFCRRPLESLERRQPTFDCGDDRLAHIVD